MNREELLETLLREVHQSRKYRGLDLPRETIEDLLAQELPRHRTSRETIQAVREKLHNIIAPYLGDPDYTKAAEKLTGLQGDDLAIRAFCLEMLESHASTRERIPILEEFYPALWQVTGTPASVLDLACALHPFGLPWMGLPPNVRYNAYDLHLPRINLLNQFFSVLKRPIHAHCQDILVNPPGQEADVALFFKEAHRFDARQHGCNRQFWLALNVKWLLVSLPSNSLSGKFDLTERQRRLVYSQLEGLQWVVTEISIENELVFCIQKS